MVTLVQLRHLVAVADSGSFSKSAQQLFISQPALSRSIRMLESELGLPLIDRIGRRNELTPFGRELISLARRLVADTQEIADSSRSMAGGRAGLLRVGLGSGPGAMLMTPLLMQMASEHRGLRVEISRAKTDLLVQALRDRRLDALVVDIRSLAVADDLRVDTIREMRGAFMCRTGHPLTRKRGRLGFADVQRFPIASIPLSDEIARALVECYGPEAHPNRCVTLRCEEIPSLVALTEQTDAVLLSIRAAGPSLVELPIVPALTTHARFGMVTLVRRTEAPGLAVVRGLMQTLLRDRHDSTQPERRSNQ